MTRVGRFTKNTLWLAVQDSYTLLITLIVGVFCARYLEPDGYGLLSYSMSFVSVFAVVCQLGLNASVVDALVKNPGDAGRVIGSALVMRTAASMLSQLGLLAAVSLIRGGDKLLLAITLLQGVSIFFDARLVLDDYFRYRLESRNSAIAQMTGVTVMCALRAALILLRADILWFALALVAQSLASFIVSAILFGRRSRVRLAFSLAQVKRLMSCGAYFMLAGISVTLYSQIDKIMIGSMLADADVGWYSVAMFVALVGKFVPGAFMASAQPQLLKVKRVGQNDFTNKFQALAVVMISLSALLAFGLLAFGPLAISLVYGSAYAPAGRVLRVLSFSAMFSTLNSLRDVYFLANGLNRYSFVFALLGAGVNILLNFLAIPLWGVMGAALATLLANVTTSIIAPILFHKTRPCAIMLVRSPARARDCVKLLKELGREESE